MTLNNDKDIDTKEEMIVHITKSGLSFLKSHYWKLILILLTIGVAAIPFIFIFKAYFGGK